MQLDKKVDAGLSRLIENYIRQLFDDRNVSPANQKKLWQHYYDTLAKGVDLGYNPKPEMYDPKLAHSLKYDVAKFSAFKETSFRKQLEAALTKDGKIVPWSEFKKTAYIVSGDYNKRWLKTEYNHTVATANVAQQWQDFEADKDLYPNLKYVTAGDARVRDAHKILDGTILPIDHPFWKSHTAPLDWGCRCNIEQSDDEPSKVIPSYKVKPEFQNNAFYSGKVFAEPAYAKELDKTEIKAIEKVGKDNFEAKNDYKTLHKNIEFKQSLNDFKNNKLDQVYKDIDVEKTTAVNIYTDRYYENINKYNRGLKPYINEKDGITNEYYKAITKTINQALDEIPDKHVGSVFRGTDLDDNVLKMYKDAFDNNKPHTEKGFLSTSYDQKTSFGGNTTFTIRSKTGVNVEKISNSGKLAEAEGGLNEKEVLFKAGQKFKVSDYWEYEENGKKVVRITMEEI